MALRIGFAQEIITPELGVPLCGYFVPRPKTGAYDDLYVRALVIEGNDGERCAIVSADLCFLSLELIDRCRCAIKNIGIDYHGKIIFSATHTHTAPYPAEFFGDPALSPGILRTLRCPQGHFRAPGNGRAFSMLLPLQDDCPTPRYFGLALD